MSEPLLTFDPMTVKQAAAVAIGEFLAAFGLTVHNPNEVVSVGDDIKRRQAMTTLICFATIEHLGSTRDMQATHEALRQALINADAVLRGDRPKDLH